MARKYPKFLWSNPGNTKSSGSFVIHTMEPRFIVRPNFDDRRYLYDCSLIEVWAEEYDDFEVREITNEIPQWFRYSGRQQSNHIEDQIIVAVQQLDFLQDYHKPFSRHQARQLIRILFPVKEKEIYDGANSYSFKHLLEKVSYYVIGIKSSGRKSCANDTIINAFEKEGFIWRQDGPNRFMNVSEVDSKRANRLFKI